MNFEEIFLSDDEFEMLRIVNQNPVVVQKDNVAILQLIRDYGFIDITACIGEISSDMSYSGAVPKKGSITLRGHSYLNYIEQTRRMKKDNRKHNMRIAIISAVTGGVTGILLSTLINIFF